jgi:hypothetical protein
MLTSLVADQDAQHVRTVELSGSRSVAGRHERHRREVAELLRPRREQGRARGGDQLGVAATADGDPSHQLEHSGSRDGDVTVGGAGRSPSERKWRRHDASRAE